VGGSEDGAVRSVGMRPSGGIGDGARVAWVACPAKTVGECIETVALAVVGGALGERTPWGVCSVRVRGWGHKCHRIYHHAARACGVIVDAFYTSFTPLARVVRAA
jgi:hypothetical protein